MRASPHRTRDYRRRVTRELRDFLQSRRARLTPAEVGLPERGRRRVAGLRREEVAQLAGVSTDYYVRLEQGRGSGVSDQVLDAVGRALRLTPAEVDHLRMLARPQTVARRRPTRRLRPSLQVMLDSMDSPAMITDVTTRVLATNALGRAVFRTEGQDRERAWYFFLDPASHDFFPNWDEDALTMVSELRVRAAERPDDARLTALVGELSIKSPTFRELWARHPVREKTSGLKAVEHPVVGRLELSYDRMLLPDVDALLYVYTAEPASETAERIALLASWAATVQDEAGPGPRP